MKTENIIVEKSFRFAVRIVKLCHHISNSKKEYILTKQLLRSGTSVGANISEGVQGSSKKDFIHKLTIALKEANETHYWIRLFKETDHLTGTEFESISEDCIEIIKILTSIITSTKRTNDAP